MAIDLAGRIVKVALILMARESSAKSSKPKNRLQAFWDEQSMIGQGWQRLTGLHKFVHFCLLIWRSFMRNRCPVRASALAYTTLLALIPLLAVGIGVSTSLLKGQGNEPVKELINKLVDQVAPQLGLMPMSGQEGEDARTMVAKRISEFIAKVNSGALGVTGTLALILVAVGLLSNIEKTLNDIWGVTRGRSWFTRLIQYWAAITLGPLLMVLAMGLTIGGQLNAVQLKVQKIFPFLGDWFFGLVSFFAPFLILTSTFMLIYMLMPNTKVNWKAALIGGLVGSVLWNLNSQFNIIFASKVVSASKIYGPLGAVPVFLLGLYFSWLIMLFGAQVAYAVQNRRAYFQEKQTEAVNERGREFVALRLMTSIGQRFVEGQKPPSSAELADALDVPTRLINQIAHTLTSAGLLVEVTAEGSAYDPARPVEKITCHDILTALRAGQGQELATREEPAREKVRSEFVRIQSAEEKVSASITVADLVARAEGQSSAARETTG